MTVIGTLSDPMLTALFASLPVEFSVIDADDKVLAWNKHETRLFKRPESVVGRDVRDCHPKRSLDKVEQLLEEMKAGEREHARFWIDMEVDGDMQKILIEYYALRDDEGTYLGCVECTQNITDIQELEGEKRLLD